ncbi:tudor domain-containing protein 10-like [Sphaerodactylus townsendi]|uniref:tudor domain-containing protein 10-like n=1 Tax=Sphaerodactylus townsendi TaxID=933632 RepID=UPI002025CE69|nr:tudor domain-containing protein 10-like [Sphaerodactylus townsendi]
MAAAEVGNPSSLGPVSVAFCSSSRSHTPAPLAGCLYRRATISATVVATSSQNPSVGGGRWSMPAPVAPQATVAGLLLNVIVAKVSIVLWLNFLSFVFSESLKDKKSKIYVGNLPFDVTEVEIAVLFRDFNLKTVKVRQNSTRSFAFVELASPELALSAIQKLNGIVMKGQRLIVAEEKNPDPKKNPLEMPDLEPVFNGLSVVSNALVPKSDVQAVPPPKKKSLYAVPLEMRSSFLVQMLRDCFVVLDWLGSICKISGEAALLVTDTVPQTPYFWAIHLTEESHRDMQRLFSILAEVESQMPFLPKQEVQRGTRCMAECIVGEEGTAWNRNVRQKKDPKPTDRPLGLLLSFRCWVVDKVGNLAVVFFMDFGHSATVPLNSLRRLNKDDFWAIQPLAQPFMLHEDVLPPQIMIRQILKGRVVQQSETEAHIAKFAKTN